MKVIPVINCPDIACVRKKIEVVKTFLPAGDLLHLDISDGSFTPHQAWGDPLGWTSLAAPFGLEVHLMVEHSEDRVDDWLVAGARRVIVHIETITPSDLQTLIPLAERYYAEIMLSSRPETAPELFLPYLKKIHPTAFHVLAVEPGPSGQSFLPLVVEKIRFLRESVPNATIEVDGGMNPATARLVRDAGADVIVSSHSIFDAADPKRAYNELIII